MNNDVVARVAGLTPAKRVLLERRLGAGVVPRPGPHRADRVEGPLPVSFGQRSQWFLNQLDPANPAFNKTHAVRIRGPLDVPALGGAIRSLVDRHEVLRTMIIGRDGEPMQLVRDHVDFRFPIIELDDDVNARSQLPLAVRRAIALERRRPFDLERDIMYRAVLHRLSPDDHVLTRTTHHVAFDKWSAAIANRELSELYAATVEGRRPDLDPLQLQYGDYAIWQRDAADDEAMAQRLDYFLAHLAGSPQVLSLVTDRPRPAGPGQEGATHRDALSPSLISSLKQLAGGEGATPFMVLLAVFGALLGRWARVEELLVGVPVAGRGHRELEDLIGVFINTVAMRIDLREDPSFQELTSRIRSATLGAMAHQDLPFERIVQAVAGERDPSRTPLVQVMFDYINTPRSSLHLGDFDLEPIRVEDDAATHDLTLYVHDGDAGMDLVWEYRADLFERATIVGLAEAYKTLLEGVVDRPESPIANLPLLSASDEARVVEIGLGRSTSLHLRTVVDGFRTQVEARPDAVAVRDGTYDLSYGELSATANRLSDHLVARGIGPGDRVGLLLERSARLVTALMGSIGVGCVAVLLDPALPLERLRMMVSSAGLEALVTAGEPPLDVDSSVVHVDLERDAPYSAVSSELPLRPPGPDAAMYVVFTSGSTGTPKGVLVAHRSVANLVEDAIERYDLEPADRVLQFASPGFDTLVEEVFPTLCAGGCLVIRPTELFATFDAFAQFVEDEAISVLDLPTAWWHAWVDELDHGGGRVPDSVRVVIVGGEAASADRWRTWERLSGHRVRWVNTYGPAETTVVVGAFEPPPDWGGPLGQTVPIGRPIDNAHLSIVDGRGHVMPLRMPGELAVRGIPVGMGYVVDDPSETVRFEDRSSSNGDRAYRTGDLARLLEDGTFEYLGRIDTQIKVRGVRVEPTEVESVLRSHPGVVEAVVVPRSENGSTGLTAHVVATGAVPDADSLTAHLAETVPQQMVPTEWRFHEELPTNATGKVDRRALAELAPAAGDAERERPAAPATATESKLLELWIETLERPSVGVDDDFFALGGHSLLGVRLLSRVSETFNIDLPLRTIFEAPTVAAMAHLLDLESMDR